MVATFFHILRKKKQRRSKKSTEDIGSTLGEKM